MLAKYIRVKNGSESVRQIVDAVLPGGKVTLEPGADVILPVDVYYRRVRQHQAWLLRVDEVRVDAIPGTGLPEPAKERPVLPVITELAQEYGPDVALTEEGLPIVTEPTPDSDTPEPETDDLTALKLVELRALAKEIGLKLPTAGLSKVEAARLIRKFQADGSPKESEEN